ncbi:hypothetical protein SISNIDRAFT_419326 [Sistotremastrum niveocremeum HHB9708]|nr:hypothetical protein SISNIDRAFT_419326 [Sistotremastrum niveocremeum HHB9708]
MSIGIIVPVYFDPSEDGNSCTDWQPLISAVSSHPDLPFFIIVNPDSGPGSGKKPDSDYQSCIPELRTSANTNVKILGYVSTQQGTRTSSKVTGDISKYAGWGSAYRPDGIFFDEGASNFVSVYSTWATDAYDSFSFVALNSGVEPNAQYFSIVDLICTAENFYADFSLSDITISPSAPASKQSVILHDGPTTPDSTLISELESLGIGALYLTDVAYDVGLPSEWTTFVGDVNSAN